MSNTVPTPETPPLPSLPSLVGVLSDTPEFEIITTTVSRYVAQRHDHYIAAGIRPSGDRGVAPLSFQVATLLQALAWERLEQMDTASLAVAGIRTLLADLLDSPQAIMLGKALHKALGWDEEIDDQQADQELLKLLTWSALILEIEPPATRKPGHIVGYDLTAPGNWGQPYDRIRTDIVDHLQWQTRTVDGNRSSDMARLALCILEPRMPDFAIPDIPKDLLYGTLRWVNFAHGVALAEVLQPGTSRLLTFGQLTDLALEQSKNAGEEALQIIAATRLAPAVQWAIAHGILDHDPNAEYSEEDLNSATSALDEHSTKVSSSLLAVLRDPPSRKKMAEQKFKELMGSKAYLSELIMRPTTFWKRLEYSLKNPAPSVRAGEFYLEEVFAAGYMKNGTDLFEPHLQSDEQERLDAITPYIERLKGIDIPAEFDGAFERYFKEAQAGYQIFLEYLLEGIPAADRICLNEGEVKVYVLQCETGKTFSTETDQDRASHRARFGFVIQCNHQGHHFSYEVFPFRAQIKKRTDLEKLSVQCVLRQCPPGSRNTCHAGIPIHIDLPAYQKNQAPRESVTYQVIAVEIARFLPDQAITSPHCLKLSSPRLKQIANAVAKHNMFLDYQSTYYYFNGMTGVEYVGSNYPPVLRIIEILVPGLSCVNAGLDKNSPWLNCVLDVATLMTLPIFRLVAGTMKVAVQSGQIGLLNTLPAYGRVSGNFIKASVQAYRDALNPLSLFMSLGSAIKGVVKLGNFSGTTLKNMARRMAVWAKLNNNRSLFRMPQRINGRIGYPLSGRGAARVKLGPEKEIKSVKEIEDLINEQNLFKDNPQAQQAAFTSFNDKQKVFLFTRNDQSKTLAIAEDGADSFIDIANNKTLIVGGHYNYKTLKRWECDPDKYSNTKFIPINKLKGERALDAERLNSIKQGITEGIYVPPIKVSENAGAYKVVDGYHRLAVANELGLEHVPVQVVL